MADPITIERLGKTYPGGNVALHERVAGRGARHLPGPARPVRLGQDDAAALPGRHRAGHLRPDHHRPADRRRRPRRTCRRTSATCPWCSRTTRCGRTCPPRTTWPSRCAAGTCPARECRIRARDDARPGRPERARGPLPERAVGRRAAAGGAGPRADRRHRPDPVRRAAVQPGRGPARADARRDLLAGPRGGRDDRVHHARPGRGVRPGRPGRRAREGPAGPGGHAGADLHPAGHPVRGPVHRAGGRDDGPRPRAPPGRDAARGARAGRRRHRRVLRGPARPPRRPLPRPRASGGPARARRRC